MVEKSGLLNNDINMPYANPVKAKQYRKEYQRLHNPQYRKWYEEYRSKLKQAGICTQCKVAPVIPGLVHCIGCRDKAHNKHQQTRHIVFDYYGNQCVCCGEFEFVFLTVDHINNDGYLRTLGDNRYFTLAKLIKQGKAPTDLQTLCYNCNCGRFHNGGICPHKQL